MLSMSMRHGHTRPTVSPPAHSKAIDAHRRRNFGHRRPHGASRLTAVMNELSDVCVSKESEAAVDSWGVCIVKWFLDRSP